MNDATHQQSDQSSGTATAGDGLDLPLGPKLASGREAEVMRAVRAWGYPVPAVHAVSGPDMVLDRVDGPTMLRDLGKRPWMLWQHARTLAKLHRRLHSYPAPDWIPTYASHPAFASLDPDTAPPAPAPSGPGVPVAPDAFLHLDLHPDNVI